ncbi:hypothetical protein LTR86_000032 [Recurvomyces mirabilis]|nr:hypothetical protein LTR86_000032 [Recurvomyces mirabilis]
MASFPRIDSVLGLMGHASNDKEPSFAALDILSHEISKAVKAHKRATVAGELPTKHLKSITDAATQLANVTRDPEEQWNEYAVTVSIASLLLPLLSMWGTDMMIQMAQVAAIRCYMEWEVFDMLPSHCSICYESIAKDLDADLAVITRLAGILVASGILQQIGTDSIAHTARSRIFAGRRPAGQLFQLICDEAITPGAHLHEYFKKHGIREPSSATLNPHTFAHGREGTPYFDIILGDPARRDVFMLGMSKLQEAVPITNLYDFSWLVEKSKRDRYSPLLVDVGGGKGFALGAILKDYPGLDQSRCVLQDMDPIIAQAMEEHTGQSELQGIRLVPHDFFGEQNVKDAYVYHIRRCLHDWSDEKCVQIPCHLRDALRPGGRILICEQILTNPPSRLTAQLDLCMMNLGGKERTPQQFRTLAAAAGLFVMAIHQPKGSDIGVVECVKRSGTR